MTRHLFEIAARSPLLSAMPDKVRDCLLSRATLRRVPRGTTVFLQGDLANRFQIVVEGWVKLYRVSPAGDEALVDLLGLGRSIEDINALRQNDYRTSCEACCDTTLVQIDPAAVGACPDARQELSVAVMGAAAQEIDTLIGQVERLKIWNASKRLAVFLLTNGSHRGGATVCLLPYEKHLLAAHLGIKPESLSRAFARLRAVGVAVDGQRVTIRSTNDLRAWIEDDCTAIAA